ncbi:MAG TPA: hypothetical protein VJV79_02960, partial [Polyangiaceae bacterium]|nr:hypothetical protein [Polyangiaceae bacterium]
PAVQRGLDIPGTRRGIWQRLGAAAERALEPAVFVPALGIVHIAPNGSAVTRSGRRPDVLSRQSDGTWRVLIDHP